MVSVIITTYNYADFIAETLSSVIAQTYTEFECIVIDDGSTDNTAEVVKPFLADTRIKYIQQQNQGVSSGRNNGLRNAQGDYILFLDADDLIEKDKLKASVVFLEANTDTALVYTDMRYFRTEAPKKLYHSYSCNKNSDHPWMSYVSGSGAKPAAVFLQGNTMVISSPVFRKSLLPEIGVFDEQIMHNEDWDFWFRIVLANKKIQYLDAPFTKALVRVHTISASLNVFKMQVAGLLVLYKNASKIASFGLQQALKKRIEAHQHAIADSLLHTKENTEFRSRIAYLKKMNAYADIFEYETGNVFIAKLYLKLKQVFKIW